jgi:hypothetical protein
MIGGGFLKAMKDAVDYNRSLLGHDPDRIYSRRKRTRREKLEGGPVDIRHVEGILVARRKYRERNATVNVVFVWVVMAMVIGVTTWIGYVYFRSEPTSKTEKPMARPEYFMKSFSQQADGFEILIEHYKNGSKAAETGMRYGKKHQQSESFYQTGEQFRSALYYYDTLVREVYRYRNGDTIHHFPRVTMDQVYHVTIPVEGEHPGLRFDFFDGKILLGTYREFR